jgi:CubicO group peptidase (beta-lactamase class C family)
MLFDAVLNQDNPYRNYTPARLLDVLKTWKAPAQKHNVYSNLGVGLLGYVLQQKVHAESYDAMLASTVTEPLKLANTVAVMNADQKARCAVGHDLEGASLSGWDFNALAGCGALHSSADDLLTFLENQLHPESSPLKDAILLSQETQYVGQPRAMGLGWQISEKDGRRMYWHNGATGGYCSLFAFEPETGTAVVFLSNTGDAYGGDAGIDRMGITLMDELSAAATASVSEPPSP